MHPVGCTTLPSKLFWSYYLTVSLPGIISGLIIKFMFQPSHYLILIISGIFIMLYWLCSSYLFTFLKTATLTKKARYLHELQAQNWHHYWNWKAGLNLLIGLSSSWWLPWGLLVAALGDFGVVLLTTWFLPTTFLLTYDLKLYCDRQHSLLITNNPNLPHYFMSTQLAAAPKVWLYFDHPVIEEEEEVVFRPVHSDSQGGT